MSDIRQFAEALYHCTMPAAPWGEHCLYTYEEWRSAADYALETDDFTEMEFMEVRLLAYERFQEWQSNARSERDAERRENTDFNDWCTIHAPEAAMKRMGI